MTQEEKQLLIKDLCARIPYRVIVELTKYKKACLLCGIDGEDLYLNIDSDPFSLGDFDIKPYLRPLSSMTEEEEIYYNTIYTTLKFYEKEDWLNAHHFDYRGLIPIEVALEAKEGTYKTE